MTYPLGLGQGLIGGCGRGWLALIRLLIRAQSRARVHAPSAEADEPPSDVVTEGLRRAVARLYCLHLFDGETVVGPSRLDVCINGVEVAEAADWGGREGPLLIGSCGRGGESQTRDGGGLD